MTAPARPLRVAFVDEARTMGGAEHLLFTLFEGLPGVEVHPVVIGAARGQFIAQARNRDIETIPEDWPQFRSVSLVIGRRKIFNPFAVLWNAVICMRCARGLAGQLESAEVDLVQTNSVFSHVFGGLAARLAGIPCAWYFHDLIENQRLAGATTWVWRILARSLTGHIIGDSHAVILPFGSTSSETFVIYPGRPDNALGATLPGDPHLRAKLGLLADATIVGYVGRIAYAKGLDLLVKAASIVKDSHPSVHFLVFGEAGQGEQSFKQVLVKEVERLNLASNFHWMGYDPHVGQNMEEFDFFVFPSRREAFGLVLVEVALAAKAVIASRIGGTPEIVVSGETGVLVPTENPAALAQAIMMLADNPQRTAMLGQQASIRARSEFGLARYYQEFRDFYARIAQSKKNPLRAQWSEPIRTH